MATDMITDKAVEKGLDRLVALTDAIAGHQAEMIAAGQERRELMLRLNRAGKVSYRRLAEVLGLATSRVITEMHRARVEAGIEGQPHPGWGHARNGRE